MFTLLYHSRCHWGSLFCIFYIFVVSFCYYFFFFFFSSRRRHTRSLRDWSSDVCSSDLSLTRESAVCPSATIWQSRPCRCRTSAMSRATCGSSSTMRITSVLLEPEAHALAEIAQDRAGGAAGAVPERVIPTRHASGQPVLPFDQRQRKCHAHGQGQQVSGGAPRLSAIEGQKGDRAPGDEQQDVRRRRSDVGE